MWNPVITFCIAACLAAGLAAGDVAGQSSGPGHISGSVVSAETGEPLRWTAVWIEDSRRGTTTDEDGEFFFRNVPAGHYVLQFQRMGYQAKLRAMEVVSGDTLHVDIDMSEAVFKRDEITIYERRVRPGAALTTEAERVITGRTLRRQLGQTIAETLDDEPGLAQRSMGPSPARPVLRGLGGDRLLIMEDQGRTGDLSATGSDHALAIEPMTAEHIELIRGPSALVHGANTLGGVINVVRGQIPAEYPDQRSWSLTSQGESVNRGLSGGVSGLGPVAEGFVYRFDGSIRNAGNLHTPAGLLENTAIRTYNGSIGGSYIQPWGMAGASVNLIDMKYGVPGGEGIADAHPGGVDVEMFRRFLAGKTQINSSSDFVKRYDFRATYSFYHHKEIENPGQAFVEDIVGSEMGVLTTNVTAQLHHSSYSIVDKGLIGLWGEYRDHASGGFSHFTPATRERALAAYAYQEASMDEFHLQAALRFDLRQVMPEQERESLFIGQIRERVFSGLSASLMGSYAITDRYKLGANVMRTFRAPGVEELFAEGPHLANFAYEVGNPDLERERGWGSEFFFRSRGDFSILNITLFRNQFSNYIFPRDTGRNSIKREDLPEYQFEGRRVLMVGAEFNYERQLIVPLVTRGTASYVRADFIDDKGAIPLFAPDTGGPYVPMIPPLNGRIEVEYRRTDYNVGVSTRYAAGQNRTDRFETPTDSFLIFDLYAQYQLEVANGLHTFSIKLENIFDTEYRNHLSRIKELMPESARNVNLLYRVYF